MYFWSSSLYKCIIVDNSIIYVVYFSGGWHTTEHGLLLNLISFLNRDNLVLFIFHFLK